MRRSIRRAYLALPAIEELDPEDVRSVPGLAGAIAYWSGGGNAGDWLREVLEVWGRVGFVMRKDGEVQGFVLYGPRRRLPRFDEYRLGTLEEDRVVLAYAEGDARVRRHLLVRMFRDLRERGVDEVDAVASDFGTGWHLPTRFLLGCGWRPVRQGWRSGQLYTLVRTDLTNTVEVRELARDLLGWVRMPSLKPSGGIIPGTLTHGQPAREHFREVDNPECCYIA